MRTIHMGAVALLFGIAAVSLAAQAPRPRPNAAALEAVLDPSVNLSAVDAAVASGKESTLPVGRFFIVTGRIGKLVDRTPEEEDAEFLGEAELTGGEWIGLEEIRSYKAFLSFSGDRFYAMGDRSDPDYIKPGTMVMVIGWYAGKKLSYGEGEKRNLAVIGVERIIPVD